MDKYTIELLARLDASKTAEDLKKIEKQLNAKGIELKTTLDTSATRKEIKALAREIQAELRGIDPGFGDLGVNEITSALHSITQAMKEAATEQEKLTNTSNGYSDSSFFSDTSVALKNLFDTLKDTGSVAAAFLSIQTLFKFLSKSTPIGKIKKSFCPLWM